MVITEPLQGVLESGLTPKIKRAVFGENSTLPTLSGVKEVKGDSPEGIGAKRRPLTSEGRQPLFSLLQQLLVTLSIVSVNRINRISNN
jgi:hypothetical protein